MTQLHIASKEFLSNYMFHPLKPELSNGDKFKAFVSSIALGIITLGILHIVCLIKYHNRTYTFGVGQQSSPTTSKVDGKATQQLGTQKQAPSQQEPSLSAPQESKQTSKEMQALIKVAENKKGFDVAKLRDAQRELAAKYRYGVNDDSKVVKVERNIDKAIFWLEKAGDLDIIANIYINKEAVAKDPQELYDLANKFDTGNDANRVIVYDLMKLAAASEHAGAMFEVGQIYFHGSYYPKIDNDIDEAIKWLRKAADKGNASAYGLLANIYLSNNYDRQDPNEGAKCLLLAFDKGGRSVCIATGKHSSLALMNREVAVNYLKRRGDVTVPF